MIIGITGYARNGKDTVADNIIKEHPNFKKYALAQPMKEVASHIFGWSEEFIENNKDVIDLKWGISPRKVLQTLGTEWGQLTLGKCDTFEKVTGRKLWVNHFLNKVNTNPKQDWIVSDVRFFHEAEALENIGAFIVRVDRPSIIPDTSHISEQDISHIIWDCFIHNDGTLSELNIQSLRIYDWIVQLDKAMKNKGVEK